MFKLLFKYVIPLALLIAVGLVGYNYFYGTPEEQESSKQIISKVKGLGQDVLNLLKSEKQKFDDGKYDDAMDKISSSLSYLKQKVSALADSGKQYLDQLAALEQEKQQLQQQLSQMKQAANSSFSGPAESSGNAGRSSAREKLTVDQIQQRINELARQTEELAIKMSGE